MPYIKVQVLTVHPLLWEYHEKQLECELRNFPNNPSEFMGDLFFEYEKLGGNWIQVHDHFWALNEYYKKNGTRNISIPEPLADPIKGICNKHKIEFTINEVIECESKGYLNRPDAKLLLFGNEVISPHTFNLGQPYVLAEKFEATKI